MPRFTTRVQLYGDPEWSDYQRLHAAMKRKEFTQTIKDNGGIEYELPHAEYNRGENRLGAPRHSGLWSRHGRGTGVCFGRERERVAERAGGAKNYFREQFVCRAVQLLQLRFECIGLFRDRPG